MNNPAIANESVSEGRRAAHGWRLLPALRRCSTFASGKSQEQEQKMPLIQVTLVRGRPREMKDKLAEELTQAVIRSTNSPVEAIRVIINEIESDDWFVGGVSQTKRRAAAAKS